MAETSLPVTPGIGANVAGNADTAGYFQQAVTIGNAGTSSNIIADKIPLYVTQVPSATDGGSTTQFFAAAMTAKASVKSSAGSVLHVNFYNPNTTDVYIQCFDTALASVTLGTTAPIRSFWVPAGGSYTDDFANYERYATAITIGPWSVAGGAAGAAPALGIVTNVDYI